MEAEIVQQVALYEVRRLAGDAAAPKRRVERETTEVGDARAPVRPFERHRSRRGAVDLDHEDAVRLRLRLRALDLGQQLHLRPRSRGGEKRRHLLVGDERNQKAGIRGFGTPERDAHGAGAGASTGRRPARSAPDPSASATPMRIRARPPSAAGVIDSSRMRAP